uniref:Mixed lineage kinase domain-containing protein n=1 Tax=Aegilops tauschii subsp. strangulata TaxID=200361 RepID=A0A453GQA5_AEGTS
MMGDAVTTVTKIVEIVMKIKKAADMVKQNEDVCKQIQSRVEILSSTLSQYQDNEELMDNWGVMRTLEALADVLGEALKLVTDCQEADTNFVCLFYNAGNLSQELIKVEQRISNKNMDAMFAIMAFLLPKPTTPSSVRPTAQERQVSPVGRQEPFELQEMQPPFPVQQMGRRKQDGGDGDVTYDKCLYPDRRKAPLQYPTIQPPNPPLQMWRQKQNEDDVDVQSDNSYTRYFAGVRAEARKESYTRDIQWDSSVGRSMFVLCNGEKAYACSQTVICPHWSTEEPTIRKKTEEPTTTNSWSSSRHRRGSRDCSSEHRGLH